MMRIYKEQSSDKFVKINKSDFDTIIFDIEILCDKLHSYCTSKESYRNMSDVVNKEGR